MTRSREEQRIIDAACQWWMGHRPCRWTRDQHLENPTVNTNNAWETDLARAVAKYTKKADSNADVAAKAAKEGSR